MIDPDEGDVRFENEGTLEPLPVVMERTVVMRAVGLTKMYAAVTTGSGSSSKGSARPALELFRGLDLKVHSGEMVAIVGESGAGKSSLLHLLAALDTPTAGEVWCGETRLSSFTPRQAAEYRNRDVGYVWQFHYLLPEFSALENVAMPLLARGTRRSEALEKARVWLGEVGLGDRAEHRSGELSGGEQQRVSLARALVTEPRLLLADEPTGDLDGKTAEAVFSLIQRLHAAHGLTSVLVTHNLEFAERCDRILKLKEGRLVDARSPVG
ncbi:ABC transporter ATP-binding protein [Granulicella sp. S190]|uniref:ABC transporter ATP-binding protein n=1 Tax=Granulicella sp. S190 TaxID=1747226 RepID=UPI0020B146D8|nr:ABC transporter ATP-binding protein [Granulicella sp. S190]